MGYLQNLLPKYMARLGTETHIVASNLLPYHQRDDFARTYGKFSGGSETEPGTVGTYEGCALHILGHRRVLGHIRLQGLRAKLRAIRPDVVQTMTNVGWIGLDAALGKATLGYKLFTASHHHASVFPLAAKSLPVWSAERMRCLASRTIPGALVSLATEKCYAITGDCADVAARFFGVPRSKLEICPLGVDTELFHPAVDHGGFTKSDLLRGELGFSGNEVVCIYTGRFSEDKNPLLLAKAVAHLALRGEPFRGLFVGDGTQARAIASFPACVTRPFVPVRELGDYYRAADIGVWPTQESMSMLDAAACGLPIVANDTMSAPERLDGNGLAYRLGDWRDLARVLLVLRDRDARRRLGDCGARKMELEFGWDSIAQRRLRDYEAALGGKKSSPENRTSRELLERAE